MHISQRQRSKRVKTGQRKTFATTLEETRIGSAKIAWRRARAASALRREANKICRFQTARDLSIIKVASVRRTFELAPELIRIAIDDDLHIGLLSVRCNDGSRLHLPAATDIGAWGSVTSDKGVLETTCASAA